MSAKQSRVESVVGQHVLLFEFSDKTDYHYLYVNSGVCPDNIPNG